MKRKIRIKNQETEKYLTLKLFVFVFCTFLISGNYAFSQSGYYDSPPNVDGCVAGVLKDSEKQAILQEVNQIRAIHGLKPVEYHSSYDSQTAVAALMLAANDEKIGNDNPHLPPSSWKCYNTTGADGCKNSNLAYRWYSGTPPECNYSLIQWMIDYNTLSCGHRRWIIDPFLKFIAFGRADGTSKRFSGMQVTTMTIYVISNDKQSLTGWDSNFVAYPYHDYPTKYVIDGSNKTWLFSFTAIFDKSNYWNNQDVTYAGATIEVKDSKGATLNVTDVQYENEGYGVPNVLKWNISGFKKDEKYYVTIKNVSYKSQKKDYSYWFKVTDNPSNPGLPSTPSLVSPSNNQTAVSDYTFIWSPSDGAETYNLQLAKSQDFKTGLKEYNDLSVTQYKVPSLDPTTKYYWRVNAKNSTGTSAWSSIWNFTTDSPKLPPPILLSPLDNEKNVKIKPLFIWRKLTNADSYTFDLTEVANNSIILNWDLSDTSFSFNYPELKGNTEYEWSITAKSKTMSNSKSSRRFTTEDLSSVNEVDGINGSYLLYNSPNPFSEKTVIYFYTGKHEKISIKLFNQLGQQIDELVNDYFQPGIYSVDFSSAGTPEGVYYCELRTQNHRNVILLTIVK